MHVVIISYIHTALVTLLYLIWLIADDYLRKVGNCYNGKTVENKVVVFLLNEFIRRNNKPVYEENFTIKINMYVHFCTDLYVCTHTKFDFYQGSFDTKIIIVVPETYGCMKKIHIRLRELNKLFKKLNIIKRY